MSNFLNLISETLKKKSLEGVSDNGKANTQKFMYIKTTQTYIHILSF